MLIIVYVGAIAVLFLFICMMLNITLDEKQATLVSYYTLGGIFGIFLIVEFSVIILSSFYRFTSFGVYAYKCHLETACRLF